MGIPWYCWLLFIAGFIDMANGREHAYIKCQLDWIIAILLYIAGGK